MPLKRPRHAPAPPEQPHSAWPRDLRAEIARTIVKPFRAYAPVDLCDQAERDIVDALPSRAGYFDARQGSDKRRARARACAA